MNLLYLIKQPLNSRDIERFGISYFLSRGHNITVLDLSELIHPELDNLRTDTFENANILVKEIKSKTELKEEKETFSSSDIVIALIQSFGLTKEIYPVFKLIAETKRPYLIQLPPIYPGWSLNTSQQNIFARIRDLLIRLWRIKPLNSILSRLPAHYVGIPAANFAVLTNGSYQKKNNFVGQKTNIVKAHTYDYDIFIRESKRELKTENQAVFIDQYLPYHVDFQQMNVPLVDPDKYFSLMRSLFERVESELGFSVVIAAHPRADYHDKPHLLGSRPVVYGKTAQMVLQSRLVIAHNSNSINFAVMAKKPIMLVVTNDIYKTAEYEKHYYDGLSKELGIPLRFIDDPKNYDLTDVMTLNDERYQRFLKAYVKTQNSESSHLWEIIEKSISISLGTEDASSSLTNELNVV